jgi:hypothetical protein
VTLRTATVTNDIYAARNTLTHRVHGTNPVATIQLNVSTLADGDRAGLGALRDWTSYIAIVKSGSSLSIQQVNGCQMTQGNSVWTTSSTGTTAGTINISAITMTVWFRGTMDALPSTSHNVKFAYSLDGINFTNLGSAYTLNTDWHWFEGQRWAIFNYATKALGGSVTLKSFTQTGP